MPRRSRLLEGHDDIDPIVWLLRLSEDPDAGVRLKAVNAFEGKITPEVTQRLQGDRGGGRLAGSAGGGGEAVANGHDGGLAPPARLS